MPTIRFHIFSVAAPDGWEDITETVEHEESPATLARGDGVGALQFSAGLYTAGKRPDPSPEDLLAMVEEFGESRRMGTPQEVVTRGGRLRQGAASYKWNDDFVRVWYVSDGLSFALVTYVCKLGEETRELTICEQIVSTLTFTYPPKSETPEV